MKEKIVKLLAKVVLSMLVEIQPTLKAKVTEIIKKL